MLLVSRLAMDASSVWKARWKKKDCCEPLPSVGPWALPPHSFGSSSSSSSSSSSLQQFSALTNSSSSNLIGTSAPSAVLAVSTDALTTLGFYHSSVVVIAVVVAAITASFLRVCRRFFWSCCSSHFPLPPSSAPSSPLTTLRAPTVDHTDSDGYHEWRNWIPRKSSSSSSVVDPRCSRYRAAVIVCGQSDMTSDTTDQWIPF